MPSQIVHITLPSMSKDWELKSAITHFGGYYIYGTVRIPGMGDHPVRTQMIDDFNLFTAADKTAILKWEKTKIVKIINLVYLELTGVMGTLTYDQIPNDYFAEDRQ
jgi:hypothetical protein